MIILMLLILLSNIIALILALVYYHLTNKVNKENERRIKEYESKIKECQRRLKLIYELCEDNIYEDIDERNMIYILIEISSICIKGERIFK